MAPETDALVALAFSGGLDTSWSLVFLQEALGRPVMTVTIDTGGFSEEELGGIESRAEELGAACHVTVNARHVVYNRFIRHLIAGNCLRGAVYPLCVAAERIVQAEEIARVAVENGADTIVHGSTGAGNDQIRFDVAFAVLAPDVKVLAPVRDRAPSRDDEYAYLEERGIHTPRVYKTYSENRGIWGTTIGGGDLHHPERPVPDDCWADTADPVTAPEDGETITLTFDRGEPIELDGKAMDGADLVQALNKRAGAHGVGRGVHTGDTILGIKGRLAFEAPAATTLLFAHRELEKLVLTKRQQAWKDQVGAYYAGLVHEALYYDPVARDLEAYLDSTQRFVTGKVTVRLVRGRTEIVGVESENSLMGRLGAVYGEGVGGWTGDEAKGFARLYGLPSVLAASRDVEAQERRESKAKAEPKPKPKPKQKPKPSAKPSRE